MPKRIKLIPRQVENKFKKCEEKSKCLQCGQCCRSIYFQEDDHYRLQKESKYQDGELKFIASIMEHVGRAEDVDHALKGHKITENMEVYRCKFIGGDNRCSIHCLRTKMCYGYPYYERGKIAEHGPWPYHGCGYERDFYEIQMVKIMRDYLYRLKENRDV